MKKEDEEAIALLGGLALLGLISKKKAEAETTTAPSTTQETTTAPETTVQETTTAPPTAPQPQPSITPPDTNPPQIKTPSPPPKPAPALLPYNFYLANVELKSYGGTYFKNFNLWSISGGCNVEAYENGELRFSGINTLKFTMPLFYPQGTIRLKVQCVADNLDIHVVATRNSIPPYVANNINAYRQMGEGSGFNAFDIPEGTVVLDETMHLDNATQTQNAEFSYPDFAKIMSAKQPEPISPPLAQPT